MLEATGWYVANYDYAEPFYFGQGQGCDFLTASCTAKTLNFDDFCTETTRGCTPQGRGGGKCGSDVRSDGCKFVHPNINYDCENEDATKYAKLPEAEVYGRTANSKCFTGSLTTKKSATKTSFCFKYKCVGSGSNLELQVQIGKQALICKEEGPLEVAGYNGVIDCPDPLRFCRTVGESYCPRGCMGRGTCTNGKCVCRKGFKGKDCGMNI